MIDIEESEELELVKKAPFSQDVPQFSRLLRGPHILELQGNLLLLLLLITAIEFSLGGSSSYTSTDKTNKNKHT